MNTRLYILAAVAALLTSCGKDPVPVPVVDPDYVIYINDTYEFNPAEVPSFGVKSKTDSLIHLDFKCVRADNEEIVIIEYQTEVEPRDTAAFDFFSPTEWDVIHDYVLRGTVTLGSGSPKPFEKAFSVVPYIWLDPQDELDCDYLYPFTGYEATVNICPYHYCEVNGLEFKAEQEGMESVGSRTQTPYSYRLAVKTESPGPAQLTLGYGDYSKTFPFMIRSHYSISMDGFNDDAVRITLTREMSEKGVSFDETYGLEDGIRTTITVRSTVEYSKDNLSTTGYDNLPTIKDTAVVENTFTTLFYGKDISNGIIQTIPAAAFDELMRMGEVESVKYNPEKSSTDIDGNTVPGFDRTMVRYQPLSLNIRVSMTLTSDPDHTDAGFSDQWSVHSFRGWGKNLLSSSFELVIR